MYSKSLRTQWMGGNYQFKLKLHIHAARAVTTYYACADKEARGRNRRNWTDKKAVLVKRPGEENPTRLYPHMQWRNKEHCQ